MLGQFIKPMRIGMLALATALAATAASAADGVTDTTVLLGMSAPLSGPAGTYGRQLKEGIEACFQKVNAAGGVHGRQLKLLAVDDGYEVDNTVANAKRLIESDKAFALMSFYGTSATAAVLPILSATGVPLVGTISGAEGLRQPVHPQMFHLRASYGDETAAIVKNLITVGVKRVAVFYQDDGFGLAGLKGVKDALAAHKLEPVAVASVPRNSTDVAAAVAVMAKADAQAVVMVTLSRPTVEFIRQLHRAKANPFFVALTPVGTDQLVAELGPDEARGIQVAQVIPYPWGDKLEIVREYKRAIAAYSPNAPLSYYSLEGYLNAKLMIAALERTGPQPSRKGLVAALRNGPFDFGGYRVHYTTGSNSGSSYVEISVIGQNGRIMN